MAIEGRRNQAFPDDFEGCIWFHCASLGEFEQGRPLIEKIKRENSDLKILLTFFSPSGYEIRKNYQFADFVCYLPFDSPRNVSRFLDRFKPSVAVFVKYEFWYFYLKNLKERQISTFIISSVFRKEQSFFRWYGGFFRKILDSFSQIFVQDVYSAELLKTYGLNRVTVAGDTRIDRVLNIASDKKPMLAIKAFCESKKIIIAGSSWPSDEAVFLPFFNKELPSDWKVIIAPHEIGEEHLSSIERNLELPVIRYSHFSESYKNKARVLLIDNIGMLSALYRFGDIAYIGGGFGAGIHNTLEPIAHGLPVIFGKKYQKFSEAVALVNSGGGFSIQNQEEFEKTFRFLHGENNRSYASAKARQYVESNRGATELIYKEIRFLFGK